MGTPTLNSDATPEWVSPEEQVLIQLAKGEITVADTQRRVWSTSQGLLLALVLPGFPMPSDWSVGDAWRRLDNRQRAIARKFHAFGAQLAERESAKSEIADHGSPS